jgi:hypothetical protein
MKIEDEGYDEAPVREHVVALARRWGRFALDVGTGACACMALALAAGGIEGHRRGHCLRRAAHRSGKDSWSLRRQDRATVSGCSALAI